MSKETTSPLLTRRNTLHGFLFAFVCAISAEAFFHGFLTNRDNLASIGRVTVLFFSLYTIHLFALVGLRSYKPNWKDLSSLILVIIFSIGLVWLSRILALGLTRYAETSPTLAGVSTESFYFGIPFAAGGLLLNAVLGLHFGLIYALSLTLVIDQYFPTETLLAAYVLATTIVACLSLSSFRSRSAYLRAGLNVAVLSFLFALASIIIDADLSRTDIVMRLTNALLGGALCSFIAAGFTPIIEYLGGYATDMRLIEMATLDHPLLKELSIQAPGTWNHSMVMGMMVEAAADATGANPILARVGAYFHDIGKMKKPLYFVENQVPGENRHDKLSTSMSALIIRSHVKDGIELAHKHKLPKTIEDMIPQHHGTSLIEYFYDKACKEAEEGGDESPEVDRSLYMYPGPKPQTREAGILMLADGIEAATRTLSEPTLDRIQGLVQKMINKVFASGELNECELTLQDLHVIAKSFTRVLSAIYHQRIAYAEPAEKISEKAKSAEEDAEDLHEESPTKNLASGAVTKKQKPGTEDKQHKEGSKEDLKRLGL